MAAYGVSPDYTTRDGAKSLARRIAAFWDGRVSVSIVPMGTCNDNGLTMFAVRSDMIDGQPRRPHG